MVSKSAYFDNANLVSKSAYFDNANLEKLSRQYGRMSVFVFYKNVFVFLDQVVFHKNVLSSYFYGNTLILVLKLFQTLKV